MLRKRVIPCLDVRGGRLVKGINFESLRDCGDPVDAATRYAADGADEIVWLNIAAGEESWTALLRAVERAAETVDVPLCVGGGVSETGPRPRAAAGRGRQDQRQHRAARPARADRRAGRPVRQPVRGGGDRRRPRERRLAGPRQRRPPPHRPRRGGLGTGGGRAGRGRAAGDEHRQRRHAPGLRPGAAAGDLPGGACAGDRLRRRRSSRPTSLRRSRPAPRRRWRHRSSTTARIPSTR